MDVGSAGAAMDARNRRARRSARGRRARRAAPDRRADWVTRIGGRRKQRGVGGRGEPASPRVARPSAVAQAPVAGAATAEAGMPGEPPGGIAGGGGFAGVAVGRRAGRAQQARRPGRRGRGPARRPDGSGARASESHQRSSSSRSWSGPTGSSSATTANPSSTPTAVSAYRGKRPAQSGCQHGERGVSGQQRAEGGVGEHQLVGTGGRASASGRASAASSSPAGRARREQREHRFGQRRGVEPGLCVVDRTLDGGLQRRVLQQGRGIGGGGAEPGEQGVDGVGVGEVQAGNSEPGQQRSLRGAGRWRAQRRSARRRGGRGGRAGRRPAPARHRPARPARRTAPATTRRPLDPEQPLDQLRSGDAARAQLGQRGRAVGRGGEVVEACGSEQGRQSWPDPGMSSHSARPGASSRIAAVSPCCHSISAVSPCCNTGAGSHVARRKAATIRVRSRPSRGERGKPGSGTSASRSSGATARTRST